MSAHKHSQPVEIRMGHDSRELIALIEFEHEPAESAHFGSATFAGHPGHDAHNHIERITLFAVGSDGNPTSELLLSPSWLTHWIMTEIDQAALNEVVAFDNQPPEKRAHERDL